MQMQTLGLPNDLVVGQTYLPVACCTPFIASL